MHAVHRQRQLKGALLSRMYALGSRKKNSDVVCSGINRAASAAARAVNGVHMACPPSRQSHAQGSNHYVLCVRRYIHYATRKTGAPGRPAERRWTMKRIFAASTWQYPNNTVRQRKGCFRGICNAAHSQTCCCTLHCHVRQCHVHQRHRAPAWPLDSPDFA